jgi:glycosyltransferase involved in cell wall biosynthesis
VKILALVTDCFGGKGGIAAYNRAFLTALCADPAVEAVIAVPRQGDDDFGGLPEKLVLDRSGYDGMGAYVRTALGRAIRDRPDLIFCGHVNLTPVGWAAAKLARTRWILQIHGIDAWQPSPALFARICSARADHVFSVSELTLGRFLSFQAIPRERTTQIPLPLRLEDFGVRPRNEALVTRYGLAGRKVVMTFGRLSSLERYKGFDEILDALPELARQCPAITYLIAGDGDDLPRLKAKAATLGVADRVVFTGLIAEEEKADTYRLADVYAMPSRGEGFGFVLLEAMACGVPAIASTLDGGREALRNGMLGQLVDPDDRSALVAAILAALDRAPAVPAGLDFFAYEKFYERIGRAVHAVVDRP